MDFTLLAADCSNHENWQRPLHLAEFRRSTPEPVSRAPAGGRNRFRASSQLAEHGMVQRGDDTPGVCGCPRLVIASEKIAPEVH